MNSLEEIQMAMSGCPIASSERALDHRLEYPHHKCDRAWGPVIIRSFFKRETDNDCAEDIHIT